MNQLKSIFLIILCIFPTYVLSRDIRIGGLFDNQDETLKIAFQNAVRKVNSLDWLLPNSRLIPHVKKLTNEDSFMASQKVCSMLEKGVIAFFGPQSEMTTSTVQSICDTLEIPHIDTRWDYISRTQGYSLNLYPHPGQLSEVLVEIIKKFDWWDSFAVLYEDSHSLARVQDILKLANKGIRIILWQIPDGDDYRHILRDIKKDDYFRIVIDCSVDVLSQVLKQAQQVGMMTDSYEYFITNLDIQTINFEDYKYSGTNITGIRILDPSKKEIGDIVSEWKYGELGRTGSKANINETSLATETALIYDAVLLFATALTALLDGNKNIDMKPLSCDGTDAWVHGYSLINYMKSVETDERLQTLTGKLVFDSEGFRKHFHIDIIKLIQGKERFLKIGYWHPNTLNITWPLPLKKDNSEERIVYNVSTKFGPPYFMNRTSDSVLTGNDRFEGFVVDLMEKIAEIANFSYNFVPAPDNGYGGRIAGTNNWDGTIGEVLKGNAQIAICDLTITSLREEVVDFSTPFMNLGISLLFRAKEKQKPELFSFLSPFSVDVWISMLAAYLLITFVVFILARPYEWGNHNACISDPDSLENNFTVKNSFWFTIGTLMRKGSDVAPRASSTRIVGILWSFFSLIIVSSYTANLAAFLMLEPDTSPIDVIEDLPTQTKIKYGCLKSGSTREFFKTSTTPLFKKIEKQMTATPGVFLSQNSDGVEKVKSSETYAFFMESTSIDYTIASECGLRKVVNKLGGNLDSKGYGIAVNKSDPLRSKLTSAILKLQEEETLENLRKTWWEEKSKVECDAASKVGGNKALSMSHVGGVFVVVIGGTGIACLMAVIEFLWHIKNVVKEGRGTLCSELINDLKFFIKCHGSSKPVRKPLRSDGKISASIGLRVETAEYSGF